MTRSICLTAVSGDKTRPVLVLTPDERRLLVDDVCVAPISSRVTSRPWHLAVGVAEGLRVPSVARLEHVTSLPSSDLGREVGLLHSDREKALARAVMAAFDLVEPYDDEDW